MVIPTLLGECGECENCKSDRTNLCMKYPISLDGLMPDKTSRMSVKGLKLYHLFSCLTFSQFMVVSTNYVLKVGQRVAPAHGSLLSCGFSTGFGAVWKEAKIERGSTIAVFGFGGVGFGAIAGAQLLGASKIIGADLNEKKKEKAGVFGMTDFIDAKEVIDKSITDVVKEMTGGFGVDYSFECTGAETLINQALEATKPGAGVTIVVGANKKETAQINNLSLLFGKTLKGSLFGGIKPHSNLPFIVQKCINKEIQLDELLTHHVKLEDLNHALELLKDSDCLKVVVEITEN